MHDWTEDEDQPRLAEQRWPLAPTHLLPRERRVYSLFDTTRGILRKYGRSIAKSKRGSDLSFGYIAVSVLNGLLRPLLAKWHPLLAECEAQRDPEVSPVDHERRSTQAGELRHEIPRESHGRPACGYTFVFKRGAPRRAG
jgi:hypothetical protein